MIATYHQVKSEMRSKEAEFARELQRAQHTELRAFNLITKLIGRIQVRPGKGNSRG